MVATRSTLSLLLLLALLAGCRTAVDDFNSQDVVVLANGDALLKDATEYAKDVGVSVGEAVRRLKLQTAIGQLDAKLTSGEPDTFGGLWIQHKPTFRVIVNMTSSAKKVAKYTRGTSFASIVEIRKVDRTLRQLEAEQAAAGTAFQARKLPHESGINVFENRAELYTPEDTQLQIRSANASDTGVPSSVKIVRTSLSEPMVDAYAGHTLFSYNGFCTAGFSVIHPDGTKGITTAAHCENTLDYGSTRVPLYWRSPEYKGGSLDWQFHSSSRLTIKPWARDNETDTGTPGYRYIYALANRPDIPLNTWVCKYGANTRYTCGFVKDKNYKSYAPYNVSTWIRVSNDKVIAKGGDSGAAVFNGHKALGLLHSGFTKDPSSAFYGDFTFMGMNYITDQRYKIMFAPQ